MTASDTLERKGLILPVSPMARGEPGDPAREKKDAPAGWTGNETSKRGVLSVPECGDQQEGVGRLRAGYSIVLYICTVPRTRLDTRPRRHAPRWKRSACRGRAPSRSSAALALDAAALCRSVPRRPRRRRPPNREYATRSYATHLCSQSPRSLAHKAIPQSPAHRYCSYAHRRGGG